jgi:hypothetical protein
MQMAHEQEQEQVRAVFFVQQELLEQEQQQGRVVRMVDDQKCKVEDGHALLESTVPSLVEEAEGGVMMLRASEIEIGLKAAKLFRRLLGQREQKG